MIYNSVDCLTDERTLTMAETLYTATVTSTGGGRDGRVESKAGDLALDVRRRRNSVVQAVPPTPSCYSPPPGRPASTVRSSSS